MWQKVARWMVLLFVCFSCTGQYSINFKPHRFGTTPLKIIWLQVAGLGSEHLAMIKFSKSSIEGPTAFEKMLCTGQTWTYNLYQIRPSAAISFLSQMIGKKNVQGNCEDYLQRPIWNYLSEVGYKVGIFESTTDSSQSVLQAQKCEGNESKRFLENTTLWSMSKAPSKDTPMFHAQEKSSFTEGKVYYDQSCQNGDCFIDLSFSATSVFERFSHNVRNYFYIIRDFSYLKALEQKDVSRSKKLLEQINKMVEYFVGKSQENEDIMFLVTSASPRALELPEFGKEWSEFFKDDKHVWFHHSSLVSPVFAHGSRAENFCGMYEEAEIFKRIMISPFKQKLSIPLFN